MKAKRSLLAIALAVLLLTSAIGVARAVLLANGSLNGSVINTGGGLSSAGKVELFGSLGAVTGSSSTSNANQDAVTHGIWIESSYIQILPIVYNGK